MESSSHSCTLPHRDLHAPKQDNSFHALLHKDVHARKTGTSWCCTLTLPERDDSPPAKLPSLPPYLAYALMQCPELLLRGLLLPQHHALLPVPPSGGVGGPHHEAPHASEEAVHALHTLGAPHLGLPALTGGGGGGEEKGGMRMVVIRGGNKAKLSSTPALMIHASLPKWGEKRGHEKGI